MARIAGLLAVAVLPLLAGVNTTSAQLGPGFGRAMLIAAGACAVGGLISWAAIPPRPPEPHADRGVAAGVTTHPSEEPQTSHRTEGGSSSLE